MPHIFVKQDLSPNDTYNITGSDYEHLARVRRVQPGVHLQIRTNNGKLFDAEVTEVTQETIKITLLEQVAGNSLHIELTLFCAILKGKSFDLVIQKATEVGVVNIVPVITERTIPDVTAKMDKKLVRWQRIAEEAAKQSLRDRVPVINDIATWEQVKNIDTDHLNILAHPSAAQGLRQYVSCNKNYSCVNLLVGPEGGFSDKEIEQAEKGGWVPLRFSSTVLKAETASIVLPALVLYELIDN